MKLDGTVKLIGQTEEVGSNGFKKRQIVISTDEQYSQDIGIDFVQDKTTLLDNFNVGEKVSVSINIRGNEYNGKYYVNIQGWRIEKQQGESAPTPQSESNVPIANVSSQPEDDLPF